MRASPQGAKILHMGARLAVGIMSATRELERICAMRGEGEGCERGESQEGDDEGDDLDADADEDLDADADADADPDFLPLSTPPSSLTTSDTDVPMPDADAPPPALTASWIVVPGEREDWEMVDCALA
ncbi:hypothetical protein C8R44DRAFT_792783 [Mycena epipterygia]|nr:hypothetical protein C8R44DRAFT_792783 [Mycena epipterygia]